MKPSKPVRVSTRAVAVSVFLLLVAGALVTSTGSGLAVPDWPLSYGKLMPPMVGGILYEHGHRMIAATVATLVGLQILVLRPRAAGKTAFALALGAFAAILAQAILGGLTVLFLLPPAVSSAHAGLAQVVFALCATIALRTSSFWEELGAVRPRAERERAAAKAYRLAIAAAAATYVQILLGAVVRHTGAGLAVPDFPLSFGRLFPAAAQWAIDGVPMQMAHRAGALAVTVLVLWAAHHLFRLRDAVPGFSRVSIAWVVLLACQVTLGASSVWSEKAVPVTVAHLAVGALLFVTSVLVSASLARLLGRADDPAAEASRAPLASSLPARPASA